MEARKESHNNELTKSQKKFLEGYYNYLGKDFLLRYGNYKAENSKGTKNLTFSYFQHLNSSKHKNSNFITELKYLIKEAYLKSFK